MIKNLDTYSIRARLYPAFIVISPVFVLITFSFYENLKVVQIVLGFLTTFGFTFLIAQLSRDRGKRKENELYIEWGGKPTTKFLRHREDYLDDNTRQRYFTKLTELLSTQMPTKEYEEKEPSKADEIYDSCTRYIINNTRDKEKFPLVFVENVNFGFRRNLWGMKPYAIVILILCICLQLIQKIDLVFADYKNLFIADLLIPITIYLLLLSVWLIVIKSKWIKVVGFEYAKRLYETLDIL